MNEDALARDLKKIQDRAFHMAEWTEDILRRFHALNLEVAHPNTPCLQTLRAWLFVPPTLWPFNMLDALAGCLAAVETGKPIGPKLRLLVELLPAAPAEAVCEVLADHEHYVQSGTYENLVNASAKFRQNEEAMRFDPQLQRDWAKLKTAFRVPAFQDAKGIIRRTMCVERNLRPRASINPRSFRDLFTAAFDAFCLRWNLYGMQGDEPLLLKLAVNVTPYGTMIHIPAYWSFDPKRDIRWDAIAKLHRLRVPGRQGAALADNQAKDRENARKLRELDRQARRLGFKGEKKHTFLCTGLGWDVRSDPKRLRRLRTEFKK